jgi:RimJ/RimL family protein N-acetyltransferase
LLALYGDPQVMRWIGDGSTYGRREVEARYALIDAAEHDHARWDNFKIIERKADGERLGQAGLLRCEVDGMPQVEIGWWLAPTAWGHGYATEAATALREYAFEVLLLRRLTVILNAQNAASIKVACRLGAIPAGTAMYRDNRVTRYFIHAATARGRDAS